MKTTILVSDPLHMRRAMLMARDAEIEAFCSPATTTRYTGFKSSISFLGREVFLYIGYRIDRLL